MEIKKNIPNNTITRSEVTTIVNNMLALSLIHISEPTRH